jgi:hypothetical protein
MIETLPPLLTTVLSTACCLHPFAYLFHQVLTIDAVVDHHIGQLPLAGQGPLGGDPGISVGR